MNKQLTALLYVNNRTGNVTEDFFTASINIASARIQFEPALRSARGLGLEINIHSLHCAQPGDLNCIKSSDICLIGKMVASDQAGADNMAAANLAAIARLKSLGSKIVLQYCDNLLAHNGTIHQFYSDIFSLADYIIYPSKLLYAQSKNYHNSTCKHLLINDPWQLVNWHDCKTLAPNEICRIIWFGSNKSAIYLLQVLESLIINSSSKRKFELTILSTKSVHQKIKDIFLKAPNMSQNWTIRLVIWDNHNQPLQLEREISRAHISAIPSDPKDPIKAGVSHNRLVDSIRGGCVTIASPMDSYKELSELALLGGDMSHLLNSALANYDLHCQKIVQSRNQILERFSPENNQKCWRAFFKKLLSN